MNTVTGYRISCEILEAIHAGVAGNKTAQKYLDPFHWYRDPSVFSVKLVQSFMHIIFAST